ncbi:MAG: LuxR C-terminal-related transcriptional regulator [Actinomycetota bacterium]
MAEATVDLEEVRGAMESSRWSNAYELLSAADISQLSPAELALFADCAWWQCRVDEEIELRGKAFAGFVAAGESRHAARAAWLLSVRHGLRGDATASSGWLRRALRELEAEPDVVEHGYLACSQTEQMLGRGRIDEAARHAERAVALGRRFEDPNLTALAISWQGLCCIARHDLEEGALLLDEAMSAVRAGELDPHFTGWVYCFVIGMCMSVADLGRAGRWAEAAWQWASSLPEATPYHGLCRVRQVEVMSLRGELDIAAEHAQRACEEMMEFEPHLAGETYYVSGEILRRKGQLEAAERAFAEARTLGHEPQPGLARIRFEQGRVDAAASGLRAALADPGRPPFQRMVLLSARLDVAIGADDLNTARGVCEEMAAIAAEVPSDTLAAATATGRGKLRLAEGDAEAALAELRPAAASWQALGLGCEAAEARSLIAVAAHALGDREGAKDELAAARRQLEQLGAVADARRVGGLLSDGAEPPHGLTERQCEVLSLVAAGRTNRQIAAELVLSPHTVARHLSNIFTKLGVTTRTEAAAFAIAHDLT